VVLSDDILTVPADKIRDIRVLATILGGKPTYGTLPGAAASPPTVSTKAAATKVAAAKPAA
jgi:hypothetical protein